jgi:hypothetical protein
VIFNFTIITGKSCGLKFDRVDDERFHYALTILWVTFYLFIQKLTPEAER